MNCFKEKKQWYSKKNIITVVFLSISLCFTVFFFSPIDVFLGNQKDFDINAYNVIFPLLLLALLSSVVLILIGFLLLKNRSVYNVITSLLFGLLLEFYIQMLLFNGNLKLLDGDNVLYSEMTPYNIFNFAVMYVIFMTPLILTIAREKYSGTSTFMNFAKGKVIPYLSALIFAMQFFGCIGMFASNKLIRTDTNQYIYMFSFEPMMSLSEEDNITVFLMDRLDGEWMSETIETFPEMNEMLEGFTFYQNNVSCYSNTFPSVPCMLTNAEYSIKEGKYDFLERAWKDGSLPDILFENGYRVNMFIDRSTTFNYFSQISVCSNIVPVEINDYKINYFGRNGIIDTMVSLSLTKLTPYFFKGYFSFRMNNIIDDDFIILNTDLPEDMVRSVSIPTDLMFNKYLNENGLRADSEQKTFTFIHMNGIHDQSEDVSRLNPSYSEIKVRSNSTTIRGNFETLFTYFHMMKELGIYDNSTIVIIADHGRAKEISTAALLIKPENAGNEPLKFDTESELSNVNFFSSILEYAEIEHSEYGLSYDDIIIGEHHPERYMIHAFGDEIYDDTFMITGDARDKSNWQKISVNDK